jgi:hypothetical protein
MELFGCNAGEYPFRYLKIPMHHKQLLNSEWRQIEERFEKRLSCWKANHLSYGGRLTLINSVLSSLPIFMMSIFEILKGVIKKLDYYRSRLYWQGDTDKKKYHLAKWDILCQPIFMMSIFEILKGVIKKLDYNRSRLYWQGDIDKKKYHLAKWDILCQPKDQGGLSIIDLEIQNIYLLSKWIVNLLNTEGTWQTILRNKYLYSKSLTQVQVKPYDSHFWRGLMKIKELVLSCGSFKIRDETQIRFWEDTWVGNNPFKQ